MKSLSVNAQEFVPGGGGLMSPIANNRMQMPPPPPPPPLPHHPPPHHHIAIPAYHDPSSPIVTFTNLSILPPGQMSGGPPAPSNIPYFNQYDLNAKLMELAANQQQQQQGQNQASSQQQYSFYSEIIPSPIVYTTAAPVIFSPAQFVHNHSSSPIAHFIAPPPPPQQAPPQPTMPPHVQPVLPHLTIGYQTAPGGSPMAQPLPPPPLQYHHHHHQQPQPQQQPIIPHPQIVQNPYFQKPPKQQQARQQNFNNNNNNNNRNNNSNNKTNRMNKKPFGNNSANAAVPSNNKPTNLEDEKEWPSLDPNQSEAKPATPYIADEAKFRKVVANVPFIKNAIEQHYLNEEKSKLSFKQALATITTTIQKAPLSQSQQPVATEPSGTKEKKKRRRSKSKKRDKSGGSEAETTEETISNKKEPFDLGKEDFPGLDASDSSNRKSLTKATSGDEIDAANKQAVTASDALNKSANGKRLNAPIVIEFANMISALEKSQHTDLANSKYSPGRQAANLSMSSQQSGGESAAANSKIERVGTVKTGAQGQQVLRRGKERENPKPKKKSTLKKIILREREEKKKTSAVLAALNESSGALQVDITSNSPVNSMHLSELFASPREQQPNQPSEEDTPHKNEEETSGEKEPENDQDEEEEEEEEEDDDDDTNTNTNTNNNEEVMSNQMSPISQNSPISGNGYAPSPYTALNVIANERSLISMDKLEQLVKQKVHSRKFREYCNQIVNRDIDEICTLLLQEIVRFQDRMYHKNPNKAKMRRRYVMGIREVTKHLKLKKLKCVILAPNCEKIESKGGLDDAINLIIQTSMEQNVPFVFALGRKGLGKAVNKLVPISVIGLFDFSGAEEYFKRLVELAENAKFAYQEMIEEYEREECENLINFASSSGTTSAIQVAAANAAVDTASSAVEAIAKPAMFQQPLITAHSHHNHPGMVPQPRIPSHMGHSRTPSNGSTISIEPFYHHMNYHTHSRSASGNFNYGQTTTTTVSFSGVPPLTNSGNPAASASGHVRSASGGGSIDLGKPWLPSHSRTPSNCSNISFISRLSEPISEVGGTSSANSQLASSGGGGGAFAAVQYYTEQVRQEMREMRESSSESLSVATTATTTTTTDRTGTESLQQMSSASMSSGDQEQTQSQKPNQIAEPAANTTTAISASLANLHLGCIDEIDGGNEADTEEAHNDKQQQQSNTHNEARSVEITDSKADETTSQ